jgi:hypothetical protein
MINHIRKYNEKYKNNEWKKKNQNVFFEHKKNWVLI